MSYYVCIMSNVVSEYTKVWVLLKQLHFSSGTCGRSLLFLSRCKFVESHYSTFCFWTATFLRTTWNGEKKQESEKDKCSSEYLSTGMNRKLYRRVNGGLVMVRGKVHSRKSWLIIEEWSLSSSWIFLSAGRKWRGYWWARGIPGGCNTSTATMHSHFQSSVAKVMAKDSRTTDSVRSILAGLRKKELNCGLMVQSPRFKWK